MATRPIDEKLVAMKMDNSDFIKKASETTKSMGLLTKFLNKIPGINLGNTVNELQSINKSMTSIDPSGLSNAINTVASRFSTLGVVGTTALVNIANRAVDAGAAMVKNLTVKPIMDGFREYETKIGSIQTILANTSKFGTNVDDVTKSLGDLNEYADKTIYNFGQMTKNIGLFTNAGLGLEESTSMIKGFANAAAASGANAEQMGRATYQLSQGLASNYILTEDWNSLTQAGMGNDNMRRDLINVAHAMGVLGTSTEHTLKNWKDTLSDDRWLTKEVFSTYLQAMAGDLDAAKLKTIGLSDAQAELLLQNAKTGEDAATKVRTFTQMMGTIAESIGSGWAETWEIMFGGFEDATQLWSGFTELIGKPFENLTNSRNLFLKTLKNNGVFEEMFVALGTAIYVVGTAIGAVTDGFNKAFSGDKVGLVTSLVGSFKSFVSALTPSEESLVKISTIFQAVGSIVKVVTTVISELGSALFRLIPPNIGSNLLDVITNLAKMSLSFSEGILNSNLLKTSFDGLGSIFSLVGVGVGYIGDKLSKLTTLISEMWGVLTTGESATTMAFGKNSNAIIGLTSINKAVTSVVETIKGLKISLDPVFNFFKSFFASIGEGYNWVKEKLSGIGTAISESMPSGTTLLAGGFVTTMVAITAFVMKTFYDITKIFSGWGNVVKGFADTLDSVSGALDSFALSLKVNALLTASIAIGALSLSILALSRVDGNKVASSLTAMVVSLSAIIGAMAIMNKYDITGGASMAIGIIGMAVALAIIAVALKQFSALNPEELTKGLISLVVAMGALAGSFALMGKFGNVNNTATAMQIVAMSASMLIMARAVKTLGNLNTSELVKGIGGLALIMVAMSGAFALMGKFGKSGASALQFIAIAASVLILVSAIRQISSIDTADLLIGLGTITAILAVIAGFAALTSGTGLLSSAVGILAISVAMNALIIPLFAIGSFPLDKLATGLLGMSAALLAIATASKLMKGTITGAASITIMAVALNLLLVPIGALAAMGWQAALIGIGGVTLALAALGGVALLLASAVPPLLGLAAAIGIMGIAMLAAGVGMTFFSTGLVALVGMTAAAVATIITTLGALITGLAALIPSAVELAIDIIKEVGTAIKDNTPEIVGIIIETIMSILTTITSYIPNFVEAVIGLITALMDALADHTPTIVNSVVNLILVLVESMARAVEEKGPRFTNAFLKIVNYVLKILVQASTAVMKALLGWIPGIENSLEAVGKAAEAAIAGAIDTAKIAEEKGVDFTKGIDGQIASAKKSGEGLSKAVNEGLESSDGGAKSGDKFASGFISGILGRRGDVEEASKQLAGAAAAGTSDRLDMHSPSLVGIHQGEDYGDGVAIGINNSTDTVMKSSNSMVDSVGSGFSGITGMIRDKLFLKDKDVKENTKKVDEVSESYDNAAKKKKKTDSKAAKDSKDSLSDQFKAFKDRLDERKYYGELTLQEELENWQYAQNVYKQGTEDRKQADREEYRVRNEIVKNNLKVFKDGIDDRKYYNDLTLQDELENWQYAQNVFLEGTEERKQADKEEYRVRNEIVKNNLKIFKDGLEDRKYYDNLTLEDELANWEYAQNVYAEGTEERKQADREVFRLKRDLLKESFTFSKDWIDKEKEYHGRALKDELDDWIRVQKRYKEGTEERKQADKEVFRVKNELNQKMIGLNDEYIKSIQDVNKTLIDEEKRLNDEYESVYGDRVKSLTNFVGLFDKVKDRDTENPITGVGLVENLRGQVNEFATWSDDIKRLAQKGIDEGLLKELEDMGPSAANEIAALNELTGAQLDDYVTLWKTKNRLARTQATGELVTLRKETNDNIDTLRKDAEVKLEGYKAEWLKKMTEIRVGTSANFVGLNDDMNKIGGDAIKGIMDGLSDMQSPLYQKAKELADGMSATIRETLGINLSSNGMTGLGQFAGEGLIDGLIKSSKSIVSQSKELALKAVDSINTFMSTFQQPSFDNEIHLKAVLDDSDVNGKLKGLSSAKAPYYLGTTNDLVSSAKFNMGQNGSKTSSMDPSKSATGHPSPNSNLNSPLIIQSILNGRIIAEETVGDIGQLMGYQTNIDYVTRGV